MNVDEIETLKGQVLYCLEQFPVTRNSDKLLTWKVWTLFCGVEDRITEVQFMQLPTEDNVKRIRSHIQNVEKRYVPTDWKIAEQRQWLQEEWEKALGYRFTIDNQAEMVF